MAKDPSVLFYSQDFLVGTSLLTPLQKGHYITLLCYQQQSNTGSLTEAEIQSLMGKDFKKQWPAIKTKFKEDKNGFYNERMRKEIQRRKQFSEKQRVKAQNRWSNRESAAAHAAGDAAGDATAMPIIGSAFLANENGNGLKGGPGENSKAGEPPPLEPPPEGWHQFPGPEQAGPLELPEVKRGAVKQLLSITRRIDYSDAQVEGLWGVFKVQHLNGKKFYASPEAVYSHFINWSRTIPVVGRKFKEAGGNETLKTIEIQNEKANEILNAGWQK